MAQQEASKDTKPNSFIHTYIYCIIVATLLRLRAKRAAMVTSVGDTVPVVLVVSVELISGLFLFYLIPQVANDGWRSIERADYSTGASTQLCVCMCVLFLLHCISLHPLCYIKIFIFEFQGFVCFSQWFNTICFVFQERAHQLLKCPKMISQVVS